MVDQPPGNNSQNTPKDWGKVVGQQPAQSAGVQPPKVAGGVSFGGEDAPPAGNAVDALRHQTVAAMAANRELRDKYADRAYQLACGCITMWAMMIGLQGLVKVMANVEMWSDKVIIAVTTGVTVSVLAAFLGVIRGLFPNGNGSGSKDKSIPH